MSSSIGRLSCVNDRVAELLELVEDLVVDARVVVVRAAEQHDAEPVLALELLQHLARRRAQVALEALERRVAGLHRPLVLLARRARGRPSTPRTSASRTAGARRGSRRCRGSGCPSPRTGRLSLMKAALTASGVAVTVGQARLSCVFFRSDGQRVDHREEDDVERLLRVRLVEQVVHVRDAELRREAGVDRAALGALLVELLGGEVGVHEVLRRDPEALEVAREERVCEYMLSTRGMPMRSSSRFVSASMRAFCAFVIARLAGGSATLGGLNAAPDGLGSDLRRGWGWPP